MPFGIEVFYTLHSTFNVCNVHGNHMVRITFYLDRS